MPTPFDHLLNQTVRIRPAATQDRYAKEVYDDDAWVSYTCRVSGKSEKVRTVDGEEAVSRYRITIMGDVAVTNTSQVEMPLNYDPRYPPIVFIGKYPDETGAVHHTTIYF